MKKLNLIRSQCIILFMTVLSLTFIGCKSDEERIETNNKSYYYYSECKNHQEKTPGFEYSFNYHVNGNDLFIEKENQDYNCLADSIIINSNIIHDTLFIYEIPYYSSGIEANCLCPRDINYSITNIPIGEYIVKVRDTIFHITILDK